MHCEPRTVGDEDRKMAGWGLLATSLAPVSVRDPVSRDYYKGRAGHPTSSSPGAAYNSTGSQAHLCIHSTHT